MVVTGSKNGFQIAGISIGYDYKINENALWRIEAKEYAAKDQIFQMNQNSTGKNYSITTSLAVSF
jgi:hypothetical protein